MNETVAITGGTGLIGTALTRLLIQKGYRVIILSRNAKATTGNISYARWSPDKFEVDAQTIAAADHIVHLAGAGVADKRWTKKRKNVIAASRVNGGKTLVKALTEMPNKVRTVVSASAIGWYGPDRSKNPKPFVESDPSYDDFLGNTCNLWEQSLQPLTDIGKRLVKLRTGIVLSNEGGAYKALKNPLKFGFATILGSGKQVMSWIHIDDLCRAYLHCIENEFMQGVYNAVAPERTTNKELILKAARASRRPFIAVSVPQFVLKMVLGEMSIEVLKSTTVDGSKLRNAGFGFLFPGVDAAVNYLARDRR